MENPINDEVYRLTVENDKKQLEKAKANFEKSYDELLKEEKAKGKELSKVVEDLLNRLSVEQKQFIKNNIEKTISKN
jgi:mRNA-degrading endonuclease YafQ of YafQ-DinJ toxin-antitoxin module